MESFLTLNESQSKRLKRIFRFLKEYDENEILEGIIKAASEEYVELILNDGSISTLNDIRKYKLFLLVKHVFIGKIPSEIEVSELFKIPISSAKTLLRNMLSSYHFEIEVYFKQTIGDILDQIKPENDLVKENLYKINIRSSYMLSEMNQIIGLRNQNCEKIKRLNSYTSYYKISNEAIDLLKNFINE